MEIEMEPTRAATTASDVVRQAKQQSSKKRTPSTVLLLSEQQLDAFAEQNSSQNSDSDYNRRLSLPVLPPMPDLPVSGSTSNLDETTTTMPAITKPKEGVRASVSLRGTEWANFEILRVDLSMQKVVAKSAMAEGTVLCGSKIFVCLFEFISIYVQFGRELGASRTWLSIL
jgi:hypothetical protein